MIVLMCAVMDTKVGAYSPPFCVKTKGEALRSFTDACGDPNLPFQKHPEDYVLWQVGLFDDASGEVAPRLERFIGANELGL